MVIGTNSSTSSVETVQQVAQFHGHMCPGLALGIRAAEVALREIGPHSSDEEVVAVVETDMCAVDAIQYMTGCTFGKGNLIHRDYGKNAYTFIRRSDGRAIRLVTKPDAFGMDEERRNLFARVRSRQASDTERARFQELHQQRSEAVLSAPIEQLYKIEELDNPSVPRMARIHDSVVCAECGEPTMETRIRRAGGRDLCPACFETVMAG